MVVAENWDHDDSTYKRGKQEQNAKIIRVILIYVVAYLLIFFLFGEGGMVKTIQSKFFFCFEKDVML